MAANTKIQFRRGYSSNYSGEGIGGMPLAAKWAGTGILSEGELGYEIDTGKFKIGRKNEAGQAMTWADLPYAGGSELLAQDGVGYTRNESTNSYTIYSKLVNDSNDSNVTITSAQLSDLISGASGTYYKLGLADDLSNIKNITITGDMSGANGTFTGNFNVTGQLTTQGNIVSNNLDLTSIVNKLIPAQPPTLDSQSLSMSASVGVVANRKLCASFTAALNSNTNNTGNISQTAGNSITNVIFGSGTNGAYVTNSITGIGPGTTGTVSAIKNTATTGQIVMTTGTNNGTNSDIIIANDRDYNLVNSSVPAGFWQSFDTRASGLSASGWNSVNIRHSGSSFDRNASNRLDWYYDPTDQLPVIGTRTVTTGTGSSFNSSSVPHWSGNFVISFSVQHLSSDTYTDDFINAISAGNAVQAISAISRSTVGLSGTPPRNYLTSSSQNISITGTALASTFSSVAAANFMPSNALVINNSRGSQSASVTPSGPVLIKTLGATNTGVVLREDNIPVGNLVQLGESSTNYGIRITGYPVNADTPSPATISSWNSSASLGAGDAAVVGGILSHNLTNYSSYIPAGPNLGTGGRDSSTSQYFTFRITRTTVSKLAIRITTNGSQAGIAGLWFKLPGTSSMDSVLTSSNGWARADQQYSSSLGFSTSSQGCAESTTVPLNTTLSSNTAYVITFGTASSSNSTNNAIDVRIKLTNGQSISSLSIQGT